MQESAVGIEFWSDLNPSFKSKAVGSIDKLCRMDIISKLGSTIEYSLIHALYDKFASPSLRDGSVLFGVTTILNTVLLLFWLYTVILGKYVILY